MQPIQRLTAATVLVLEALLSEPEPVWGLKIAKLTDRAPGSIYPILARLEDSHWVAANWDDDDSRGGPRRRMYSLTDEGAASAAQVVAAWHARAVPAPRRSPRTAQA